MTTMQDKERLHIEIELLESMYPNNISFRPQDNDVTFTSPGPTTTNATLRINLASTYPTSSLPTIISATDHERRDIKGTIVEKTKDLEVGEEIIDAYIEAFNCALTDISDQTSLHQSGEQVFSTTSTSAVAPVAEYKTVIVWLHHLLNTSKRQQVLAPDYSISGVSKPGYPGILVFSGAASEVDEHVKELKGLNWQAFQVRHEVDQLWQFVHGVGVIEVEGMGDVVKEIGDERKELFMDVMRMR